MTGVASAVVAGVGAVATAGAAMYGADKQASAAKNAQNIAQSQYQQNKALEAPYNQEGQAAMGQLNNLLGIGDPNAGKNAGGAFGSLNAPFTTDTFKTMSPAYQFQMQQGQQGVLNQETGTGALSGAALKDLTSFNQNYANTAFNNAFNQYQTQQSNTYSRLANLVNLGQSAASGTAQSGTALAGTAAQAAQNVGTAQAGGAVGAANALTGGASNAAMWANYGGGGAPNPTNAAGYGDWYSSLAGQPQPTPSFTYPGEGP
jgi:hypothetical protein